MKKLSSIMFVLLSILVSISCSAQDKKTTTNTTSVNKIEVYYFHYTRRCHTCISVEENSKKAMEALYPTKIKNGEYSFKAINLDDDSSKEIAEKLNIGGQTLLVVCGNKKIDITDKGFMYAQNFDKMKNEIKKTIDNLLN